jgi:hypothetical protein
MSTREAMNIIELAKQAGASIFKRGETTDIVISGKYGSGDGTAFVYKFAELLQAQARNATDLENNLGIEIINLYSKLDKAREALKYIDEWASRLVNVNKSPMVNDLIYVKAREALKEIE